jgi:hypothetical protein
MVLNRLPFLTDDATNETLLSHFTLEVMNQLEPCLKISSKKGPGESVDPDPADTDRVGQEEFYWVDQQSLIADIVTCYVLMLKAAEATEAASSGGSAGSTFLKKAQAGSASVEFDQFSVTSNTASLGMSTEKLLELYRGFAMKKGLRLGCRFEICSDCTLNVMTLPGSVKPFIVPDVPGCGYTGDEKTTLPEIVS